MAPLATRAPLAALAALSALAGGALAAPCTSLPIAAGLTAASCACTQGNPASCTFAPETNATVGLNAVNPCVDHYVYLRVATGLQKAAADPKVAMPFSAPTPRTFCLNNFCGPNAGPAVQTFTAGCGAGYWGAPGAVTGTCTSRANCWNSGSFGSLRGIFIYNLGPNSSSLTVASTAVTSGPCTANIDVPPASFYVGFDSSSGNLLPPSFTYSTAGCTACPAGTFGALGITSAAGCTPCPPATFAAAGSAACAVCAPGSYGNASSLSCATCPAGTFSAAAGASSCATCAAGSFAKANATACTPCAAGSVAAAAGAGACTACAVGTTASADRTVCVLPSTTPSATPSPTPSVSPPPSSCFDGVVNAGESDVDCGGASSGCMRCALGGACRASADCSAAAICTTGPAGVGDGGNVSAGIAFPSPSASTSPAPSNPPKGGAALPSSGPAPPLVGVCVDPQLAAAAWGPSAALAEYNTPATAVVALAALTPDGLAALQAALACASRVALAANASAAAGSGAHVVAGASATLLSKALYTSSGTVLMRATLSVTLIAAGLASAPPAWQAAVQARVDGGALAPVPLSATLASCLSPANVSAAAGGSPSAARIAAAAAWHAAAQIGPPMLTFAFAPTAVAPPAAFVTIEQQLAAGPGGVGSSSGGGGGADATGAGAAGGLSFGSVIGIIAGGVAAALVAGAAAVVLRRGGARRRRPRFEKAADAGGAAVTVVQSPLPGREAAGGGAAGAGAGGVVDATLGWTECRVEATGQVYYHQAATGTTVWTLPLGAVLTGRMSK